MRGGGGVVVVVVAVEKVMLLCIFFGGVPVLSTGQRYHSWPLQLNLGGIEGWLRIVWWGAIAPIHRRWPPAPHQPQKLSSPTTYIIEDRITQATVGGILRRSGPTFGWAISKPELAALGRCE